MAISFTERQQQVIEERNCNLLVSAAAGSGKTAVLVERIIRQITDQEHPVDIDRLLVVTFTSAAAAEMRERVSNAINDRLAKEPENEHLQKQATLLHNAQITTIDSFCLFVLRNQFHTIGLDPGFRIGDEGELKLLRADVLSEVLEAQYAAGEKEFLYCMEYFGTGSRDDAVEELVEKLYDFAMSNPFPEEWLEQRRGDYRLPQGEETFEELLWVRELFAESRRILQCCAETLQGVQKLCEEPDGPYFYGELIEREKEMLEGILHRLAEPAPDFDALCAAFSALKFDRLPSKKDETVSVLKRELAKNQRADVKETLLELRDAYFSYSEEQILERMKVCDRAVNSLVDLVLAFSEAYAAKKREKNVLDFDDVEHFALSILVRRTKEGGVEPTESALEYRSFFHEIMIDEYQDSNLVQEYLLSSISGESEGRYNRFMVGDVKQSIYKFRLARPELFLEKYREYAAGQKDTRVKKIDLHQNFRSRQEVLESTNGIFERLMGEQVGGIIYDEQAALHKGAQYPESAARENDTELLLFLTGDKPDELSVKEQEAYGVAARIKELMRSFQVAERTAEGTTMRRVHYRDIVILLRTTSGWAEVFRRVLEEEKIPVHMTSRTGYFAAAEVQELLNYLRILDNPLQDIPLYGALHSVMGGFTEEEIAKIRAAGRKEMYLYDALCRYPENCMEEENPEKTQLLQKISDFQERLRRYRRMAAYLSVQELLQTILRESGYLNAVLVKPDGSRRRANVEMLLVRAAEYEKSSYFGLYHFLRYMEQLEKYEVDYGEAGQMDENADVVRLMSVHKSKGLEFPVCFVCGLSKHFQTRDSSAQLVVDMDAGIGVDDINPQLRVRSRDIRRRVISDTLRRENLAEELRILYVAMTRAKEKLILTGTLKSAEKTALQLLPLCGRGEKLLPYERFLSASSFMDLVLAALAENRCMDALYEEAGISRQKGGEEYAQELYFKICLMPWQDSVGAELKEELSRESQKRRLLLSDAEADGDTELMTLMSEHFAYRYPHENLAALYTKTTVSELKKAGMQEEGEAVSVLFEEKPVVPYLPGFLREEEGVSGTQRGTAFHKVMELLDFSALHQHMTDVSENKEKESTLKIFLEEQFARMCAKGRLPKEYEQAVSRGKLQLFLESAAAKRMAAAAHRGKLYKEQPFVMGLPANRLKAEFPESETVLIQGIIDVFFEEEDGLVVLDYKTDAVSRPEELIGRYQVQLDYYAQALEQIYERPVKEKIIYSFKLGQEISLS